MTDSAQLRRPHHLNPGLRRGGPTPVILTKVTIQSQTARAATPAHRNNPAPLPKLYPGEGRGPVGKRRRQKTALSYADLTNWTPASAGVEAICPPHPTPNGTTWFACVCPTSARPRYGTPISRAQRTIM